jgi:ferritin
VPFIVAIVQKANARARNEGGRDRSVILAKTIQDAMNEQIKNELYSAHQYPAMSAYWESVDFPGFASRMRMQAQEEREHAMKFYGHIQDRDGRVVLRAMEQPIIEFASPLEVFEKALEQEQAVTADINELYALAVRENDYASICR